MTITIHLEIEAATAEEADRHARAAVIARPQAPLALDHITAYQIRRRVGRAAPDTAAMSLKNEVEDLTN